ncbi:MAG: GatB/YqeY domain-containing protein, partial [Calditrichaeota bacterium]|nr:GatB/YqeY domain-containing protein [Calditrichota bacterium]
MMLDQKLAEDLKTAMKAKDKIRLETIRMLRSELKNAQISKGGELDEGELMQVLSTAAKRRREAIEQYQKAGHTDRAEEEGQELRIIEAYLPAQLDESAVTAIVAEVIASTGAASMKDMGAVMA